MKRNENAVSPITSVILMVAISVIITAVIISFYADSHYAHTKIAVGDYTYNYTSEMYGFCAHDGIIIPANTTRVFNYTDGRNVTINCR